MMRSQRQQSWWIFAGLILLSVTIVLLLLAALQQRHTLYQDLTERNDMRSARLLGLLEAEARLQEQAVQMESWVQAQAIIPPAGRPADLNLIRVVQNIFSQHGLAVQRIQEQPRRDYPGVWAERLQINASGTLPQLLAALTDLYHHHPRIRVETLRLHPDHVHAIGIGQSQSLQIAMDVLLLELEP